MKQAYLKYLLALLLFGGNGIVASRILLDSSEIVFYRTLIGSGFLLLLYLFSKGKIHVPKDKKHFAYLLISGAAMGGSWIFLFEAYERIGVSISTLAYYCGPVIVMALSPFLFKERMTFAKAAGLSTVLLGMFLVNGKEMMAGGLSFGLICGILSAAMYVVMVVSSKKAHSITGLENSMYQLIASFLTVAIFLFAKQGIAIPSIAGSVMPILILGVVNTGIGCYLYFSSIQKLPVGTVSICGYLEPLSALLFSAFLLQEHLSSLQAAGAVLILGGAIFAESSAKMCRSKAVSSVAEKLSLPL